MRPCEIVGLFEVNVKSSASDNCDNFRHRRHAPNEASFEEAMKRSLSRHRSSGSIAL